MWKHIPWRCRTWIFQEQFKLPSTIVSLLNSFLTNRTLTVFVIECKSHTIDLNARTPQGSCLSPLLYIMYVNDIRIVDEKGSGLSPLLYILYVNDIKIDDKKGSLSQFADDIGIWLIGKTYKEAMEKLQLSVNWIVAWCNR